MLLESEKLSFHDLSNVNATRNQLQMPLTLSEEPAPAAREKIHLCDHPTQARRFFPRPLSQDLPGEFLSYSTSAALSRSSSALDFRPHRYSRKRRTLEQWISQKKERITENAAPIHGLNPSSLQHFLRLIPFHRLTLSG
jgi:hypothetical protein